MMNDIIIYLLKVIAVQAILILFYRLVLRNTGQHQFNRVFVISALIVSFCIPFAQFELPVVLPEVQEVPAITWLTEPSFIIQEFELIPIKESHSFSWWQLLPLAYGAITLIFLVKSIFYLSLLQGLKRKSSYVKKSWFKLFKISQDRPFSFFSNVFMPESLFGKTEFDQILAHECEHVKQYHSIDRVLMDFVVSLFWFNPFIYLYRNALIEIHEFQADEVVLNRFRDPIGYQEILYSQLQSVQYSGLVSHFNFSMIKKRIVMMNKKSKTSGWVYMLTLPVVLSVVFAFSSKETMAPIAEVGEEIASVLGPERDSEWSGLISENLTSLTLDGLAHNENQGNKPSILPLKDGSGVRMTSGYGMRMHPILKVRKMHVGTDFSCPMGSQIIAPADGTVLKVESNRKGYGKLLTIDHGDGFETRYAQLLEFKVKEGEKVSKGDVVALSGNSGASTAPHLHYEVKKDGKFVDPASYITDYDFRPRIKEVPKKKSIGTENEQTGSSFQDKDVKTVLQFLAANEDRGDAVLKLSGIDEEPLLMIDGETTSKKLLWLLGPEDFQSITVHRPHKAKELFGAKGANGVVELFTKPYQNESVAYIYKGELLFDFDFEQIEEEVANIQMVSPRYLDKELPSHIKNVYVINDPEVSRRVSEKMLLEEQRYWPGFSRKSSVEEENWSVIEKVASEKIVFQDSKEEAIVKFRNDSTKKPLFVIDGKVVKDVSDLNPNQIESVMVLKGKKATKKYGDSGVDGVIEILTKNALKKEKKKIKGDKGKQAYRVIIDAGHGGKDQGAQSELGLSESEIVLAIAKKIQQELEEEKKIEVVLSREEDDFLELKKRTSLTDGADLLISLHTDNYEGKGSFVLPVYNDKNEFADGSYLLAQTLAMKFEEVGKSTQLGYSSGYYILNNAKCPAVLLNVGWVSDQKENTYLSSASGQLEVAEQISDAIRTSLL